MYSVGERHVASARSGRSRSEVYTSPSGICRSRIRARAGIGFRRAVLLDGSGDDDDGILLGLKFQDGDIPQGGNKHRRLHFGQKLLLHSHLFVDGPADAVTRLNVEAEPGDPNRQRNRWHEGVQFGADGTETGHERLAEGGRPTSG